MCGGTRTVAACAVVCLFVGVPAEPGVVTSAASAQAPAVLVRVEVHSEGQPIGDAEVVLNGVTHRTDRNGTVTIAIPGGSGEITVAKDGLLPATVPIKAAAGSTPTIVVELLPQPTIEEEVTVIATTRTDKRLEDQPMRVEVLDREEIEEKMLMTPGDIVMMLNEMGGMRVQATSPSLGAASVRIQGMRGRYTRVLSDGLPLFGEVGGIGLLQIPPMDLGQVEVVKGVASALYGAGAMGGIVNLQSRRPTAETEHEILLNQSTRGATDAVMFLSGPIAETWGASLLGGGHWQQANDVDGDEWADLASYSRGEVRPRFFWDGGGGRTIFGTAGYTFENRQGGTLEGQVLEATGAPYIEALETRKYDVGVVAQTLLAGRYVLTARGAFAVQNHHHQFGGTLERDRHETAFGEAALRGNAGRHTWVVGGALERDAYHPEDVPRFEYAFTVPGAFAQYDVDVNPALSLSASGRLDIHSEYGTFFSPRISARARSEHWTSRLSVGTGFFGPTPITEETEAAGLTRLTVPDPLVAERGLSASFDLTRTDGPLSYTATLFTSRIEDPLHVERKTAYVLENLDAATTNAGIELLGTYRRPPFSLTATYTFVRALETVEGIRDDVPLTPRHSAGIVGIWEKPGAGRIGVEWYYTGRQRLEDNQYRTTSNPYFVAGLLAEWQQGPVRLFVNAENFTDVRQTKWDPLLRTAQAVDGRWTVDAWAPLEGWNVNGGLRLHF